MIPAYPIFIYLGRPMLTILWPNDFRDVENVNGVVESSHKNGIYVKKRNVTEFSEFWMNQKKHVSKLQSKHDID